MPILELRNITKTFHVRGSAPFKAVDDVSIYLEAGECLAVVGESGSGKSTLARVALNLLKPDAGEVVIHGVPLSTMARHEADLARLRIQPVFQDPAASFNPRRTVASSMIQAMRQAPTPPDDMQARAAELLAQVGLRPPEDLLPRLPHELSGGQRQRLAIARALALDPELIIADEPLSGADVSIRAQILNLMLKLQRERGLAYMLITHDMLVARAIADRVAVMQHGRIVEQGLTSKVLSEPSHPYTIKLLEGVQSVDVASLVDAPAGS